jgi:YHS domain-containing protein
MKILMALTAAALALAGCQSGYEGYTDANRATHTWKTNEGTFAMDHVSNHRVDASKAIQRSYLGEVYYFENEDNARKFDQNPDAYLYDHNNPERSAPPGMQGASHD